MKGSFRREIALGESMNVSTYEGDVLGKLHKSKESNPTTNPTTSQLLPTQHCKPSLAIQSIDLA
jgi:hypothetical protein